VDGGENIAHTDANGTYDLLDANNYAHQTEAYTLERTGAGQPWTLHDDGGPSIETASDTTDCPYNSTWPNITVTTGECCPETICISNLTVTYSGENGDYDLDSLIGGRCSWLSTVSLHLLVYYSTDMERWTLDFDDSSPTEPLFYGEDTEWPWQGSWSVEVGDGNPPTITEGSCP